MVTKKCRPKSRPAARPEKLPPMTNTRRLSGGPRVGSGRMQRHGYPEDMGDTYVYIYIHMYIYIYSYHLLIIRYLYLGNWIHKKNSTNDQKSLRSCTSQCLSGPTVDHDCHFTFLSQLWIWRWGVRSWIPKGETWGLNWFGAMESKRGSQPPNEDSKQPQKCQFIRKGHEVQQICSESIMRMGQS